jgi:8-oxo-dGTP pyrophosphatase MutT (NUDIX family)
MTISAPLSAATVVLLREQTTPLPAIETFLLRRPNAGAFAGAHVFPGGRVDAADGDARWRERCHGLGELTARLAIHLSPEGVLAHGVAAVREVFEETGVLLATAGRRLPGEVRHRGRDTLLVDPDAFLPWCVEHDIRLAFDALHPWAHWITPEAERRRFDAWFFLAVAPPDQPATPAAGETLDGGWISVPGALEALVRGEIFLTPPTLRTLEELQSWTGLGQLATASRARTLLPVMPRLLPATAHPTLVMPGDPEYGEDAPCGVTGLSRFVLRDARWWSEGV